MFTTHVPPRTTVGWAALLALALATVCPLAVQADDIQIEDAVSREFVVFNDTSVEEVISREFVVLNDTSMEEAISREFVVMAQTAGEEAISREFTVMVDSSREEAISREFVVLNDTSSEEAIAREFVVYNNPVNIADIPDAAMCVGPAYTGPLPDITRGTPPITWTLQAGPGGMSIDPATGMVSWLEPTIEGSPHTITIRATNAEGFDEETWTLTVAVPPMIEDIADTTCRLGVPYVGPAPVILEGPPQLTWSLVSGPPGMTIDASTGVVTWSEPTDADPTVSVTIRGCVTNTTPSCCSEEAWSLGIQPPPIVADIPDASIEEAVTYQVAPTLLRSTGPVTWTLVEGPADMVINASTGIVTWPSPVGAASPQTVTIQATDDYGSDTESWQLTVPITYTATASTDIDTAPAGTLVLVTGEATRIGTGDPVPNAVVSIRVRVRNTRRVFNANCNGSGLFQMILPLLSNEAGRYQIGADHPSVVADKTDDDFTLYGMTCLPATVTVNIIPGEMPQTKMVDLTNLGDTPLTGITVAVENAAANLSVQANGPDSLPVLGTGPLRYTVLAQDATITHSSFTIRAASIEGAVATLTVTVNVSPLVPHLVADPASLSGGMVLGQQTFVQFDVTNDGGAISEAVHVQVPQVPWLTLATPDTLDPLSPGGKGSVVLNLQPSDDLPLGPYAGTIVVSTNLSSVVVPFTFNAISDKKGSLRVRATDEYTYYAAGSPGLSSASVTVKNPQTGEVSASGLTDANGVLLLEDLTEGYYDLEVMAADHGTFQTRILSPAGTTIDIEAFLPRQLVRYLWTVVPTQVEDQYTISIEAVFETEVPAPVITIEPAIVDLAALGCDAQVDFTVTNHGLVAAKSAELFYSSGGSRWEVTPLVQVLGDIPAHGSAVIPVRFRDRACTPGDSYDPCAGPRLGVGYQLVMGSRTVDYQVPVAFQRPPANCPDGGVSFGQPDEQEPPNPVVTFVDPSEPLPSVDARVRITLDQQAVISRSAFEATLELQNGDVVSLDDVAVDITIKDTSGQPANDRFAISDPTLTGLSDVDGGGSVAGGGTGRAVWTLLPSDLAAPHAQTTYFVGGTLTYRVNDQLVTIPLLPARIAVLPNPSLHLKYFLERTVYSDDPFTPEFEPAVPFSLGLLMSNTGAGVANNVRIASAQPKIIENEKGLLIDFMIIGTKVGSQSFSPSLTANLGDVGPQQHVVAQWLMTASLQGEFIEYNATYQHVSGLGDPNQSLIDSVEIFEMVHVARVDRPADDALPDFLVRDPDPLNAPYSIHSSTGPILSVTPVTEGTTQESTPIGNTRLVQLTIAPPSGWAYIRIPNPVMDGYRLSQVIRSDNRIVRIGDNAWTTHRIIRAQGEPPTAEDLVHIVDHDSTGIYQLVYVLFDSDQDGVRDIDDLCPNTPPGVAVGPNGCPIAPGDFDGDGDVDTADLALLEACALGPMVPLPPACDDKDLDNDGDSDQADFAIVQRCYSGENHAPEPSCAQ